MPDDPSIRDILRRWALDLVTVIPNEEMQGSPERSLYRTIVADAHGRRFILEKLAPDAFDPKTIIAQRLQRLSRKGLAVAPYRKGTDGHRVQRCGGFCWQLSPYIDGLPLDRERYWDEPWRGETAGRFLVQLRNLSMDWETESPVFSMPVYIDELVSTIQRHNPEVMPAVDPLVTYLKREFYPLVDRVPTGFCHGDPHPLNMIWGPERIEAVIDWEFCGWKPILYDAALVIGCVGAEAAEAANAGFISGFLSAIGHDNFFTAGQLALLPLFVLAVRFGWLSEWLRKQDREMIEFELFYMGLLMEKCRCGV